MKPERIAEIADYIAQVLDDLKGEIDPVYVINRQLTEAIEEENRWFYPEIDKLPHDGDNVLFCTKKSGAKFGKYGRDKNMFLCLEDRFLYSLEEIKCWRYAPEVPE